MSPPNLSEDTENCGHCCLVETTSTAISTLSHTTHCLRRSREERAASIPATAPIIEKQPPVSPTDYYAQLCTFAELPGWMQDNEFICAFYRPPLRSYRRCIASLVYLHNETGNIYSHGLGAALFLALGWLTGSMITAQHTASWHDALVFYVFLAGAITCLAVSATFHLVACHSEHVSASWNRCDYIGIVLLIVGSFYPIIYYAFYCHALPRTLYLAGITTLGALTVTMCVSPQFAASAYRPFRTAVFIALGGSGVVPMVHALLQFGWQHIMEGASLLWIAGMGAMYVVGALIYAARVPERWWPGRFDLWLHSHQIFHLFVLAAATLHYVGLVRAFRWHHSTDPFCLVNPLRLDLLLP